MRKTTVESIGRTPLRSPAMIGDRGGGGHCGSVSHPAGCGRCGAAGADRSGEPQGAAGWASMETGQGTNCGEADVGAEWMKVIARIPRLDGTSAPTAPQTEGSEDSPTASGEQIERLALRPSSRRPAPRFPLVSTLVLSAVTMACWAAVWWSEKKSAAAGADAAAHADDVATQAPAGDSTGRSLTR